MYVLKFRFTEGCEGRSVFPDKALALRVAEIIEEHEETVFVDVIDISDKTDPKMIFSSVR